jgi:hypothetical protein
MARLREGGASDCAWEDPCARAAVVPNIEINNRLAVMFIDFAGFMAFLCS